MCSSGSQSVSSCGAAARNASRVMPMFGLASSSSWRYLISFALSVTGWTKTQVFHSSCAGTRRRNVSPVSSALASRLARMRVSRWKSSRSYASTSVSPSTRAELVPFLVSASLTSKRSAKSAAASRRSSTSIGSEPWLITVTSSWKPSPIERLRMIETVGLSLTVPTGGTRKNCAVKYWFSSVESTLSGEPFAVSSQRETKRVSRKKKPCAWSGDASMSPRRSLTRKVEPSRMLIVSLAICCSFVRDEEDARRCAVRADELQRGADQLVLARLDAAKIEAFDRDDACAEQRAVRGLVSDRQVVDADKANPLRHDSARRRLVERAEVFDEGIPRPQLGIRRLEQHSLSAIRHADPFDDDAVSDEHVEWQLLRGGGAVEEVQGCVDVRAGVDSELEPADVREGAVGDRADAFQLDGRVARVRDHAGTDRNADVDDPHQPVPSTSTKTLIAARSCVSSSIICP